MLLGVDASLIDALPANDAIGAGDAAPSKPRSRRRRLAQRPTGVVAARPAAALRPAAVQTSVEALKELRVELGGLDVAEAGQDVEPNQVVVPLAGGVLELSDIKSLRDGLPHCDVALGVPVLVDLVLEPGQEALGLGVGLHRLSQLAAPSVSGSVPASTTARQSRRVAVSGAREHVSEREHEGRLAPCQDPCHKP